VSYTMKYLDDVRRQIAPDDVALKEAAERRDNTRDAAMKFHGALRTFASGSLAHRTANCPVHRRDAGLDADCGIVLDRRTWNSLGPDSATNEGPNDTLRKLVDHLRPLLGKDYPNATFEVTKRAILIRFNAPLPGGEDPTVDIVLALDRKDEPGLWIPNTEKEAWDPSHPEEHTRVLTAPPQSLRLVRQHAIRLAKAENKREATVPLCSFNLEAFGLMFVTAHMNDAEGLLAIWSKGADDLNRRLTPDPAGVSAPIKVEDIGYALRRLTFAARHLQAALDRDWDEEHVRGHLYELWPEFVPARAGAETKARVVAAWRNPKRSLYFGGSGLVTAPAIGAAGVVTSVRSYGDLVI
jgi:hypothetical protein